MAYLTSPRPGRPYQISAFEFEKKAMLVYDFSKPRTRIEKLEMFSKVRSLLCQAMDKQISDHAKSVPTNKKRENWAEYLRANRKQYGRFL